MQIALLLLAVGAMANPKESLLESSMELSAEEEALAAMTVNEISTHEWSTTTKKMPAPDTDLKTEAPQVEAWYINSDAAHDRASCMESQLTEAGYAPLRFSALQTATEDCLAHGIEDMPGLSEAEKKDAISSWCNHKKLFEALSAAPSTAEYFLVLEDTPVINTKNMKKLVDDFLAHTEHKFSLLQLDPYGGIGQPVSFHRGRPLFQPSEDLSNAKAYRGSHAMLVKKSSLSQIVALMSKRKATKVDDLVLQLPSAMAMSGGIAMSPMINKFRESLALPKSCKPAGAAKSSFIQSELNAAEASEQDMWKLWPREGDEASIHKTAWWVPNAKSWISFAEAEANLTISTPSSKYFDVVALGAHDEDPSRAACFHDGLMARGMGDAKRVQLLQIPADCTAESDATQYQACLARNGLDDCSITGKLNLEDMENVDWEHRLAVRDHVTKSTCGFQRALKQLKQGPSPYVLLLNENAVLGKNIKKQIESFIEANPEDVKGKAWSALQIDSYGREAPIDQGLGAAWSQEKPAEDDAKIADFNYLSDEEAKSRFWGMHAVLVKRQAIPTILAEMQMEDGTAIGAVDRIPRHTQGWLAANLGVAYDPHMALLQDECVPSRAEHFKVARSEIPESWTVQKE